MISPEVSVVMGVYNGAEYLHESLESILGQEGVDIELIIVNDGSTDESQKILEEYAMKYKCIRLVNQENQGLTRSLIKGCDMARGEYIARQDADDVSLPGRFSRQSECLRNYKEITLVSCWTIFTGPKGEEMYRIERHETPEEATRKLHVQDINKIQGVSGHGSTMFRRNDYFHVGGYRKQFYFAQDLDLWLRLTDSGLLSFIPEFYYKVRFTVGCISTAHHKHQIDLTKIMIDLTEIRKQNGDETDLLKKAESVKPKRKSTSSRDKAKGFYFIGKCLMDNNDRRGMKYLFKSAMTNPLMLRSWTNLFLGTQHLK